MKAEWRLEARLLGLGFLASTLRLGLSIVTIFSRSLLGAATLRLLGRLRIMITIRGLGLGALGTLLRLGLGLFSSGLGGTTALLGRSSVRIGFFVIRSFLAARGLLSFLGGLFILLLGVVGIGMGALLSRGCFVLAFFLLDQSVAGIRQSKKCA